MADLITHACTALLWRAWRPRAHTPSFVAGSLLPDLLSRVPAIGLTRLHDQLGWGIPDGLIYGFSPLHLPIGMLLSSYVLALLFPAEQRRGVFRAILGGMALHLAVDLLQNHLGAGYALFYPFSLYSWELGWMGSEDTVYLAPPLVLVTALVWRRRRREMASRTAAAQPPPPAAPSQPQPGEAASLGESAPPE